MEIAGEYRHPLLSETITELHSRLNERPLKIVIADQKLFSESAGDCEKQLRQQFGEDSVRLMSATEGSDADDVFATVLMDASEVLPACQQPPHEAGRGIRVSAAGSSQKEQLLQALADLCSAVCG